METQLTTLKNEAAPDKHKLLTMIVFSNLPEAGVKTQEGHIIENQIREKFESFKKWANQLIETL